MSVNRLVARYGTYDKEREFFFPETRTQTQAQELRIANEQEKEFEEKNFQKKKTLFPRTAARKQSFFSWKKKIKKKNQRSLHDSSCAAVALNAPEMGRD